MYEEVPRNRRGLASYLGVSRLTARRIVLGPFVIGGGVLLTAVGGSVAVAATVLTATTLHAGIHASDLPPHPHQPPAATVSSISAGRSAAHASSHPAAGRAPAVTPPLRPAATTAPRSAPSTPASLGQVEASPAASMTIFGSTTTSGTPAPTASRAPSSSPSPAGNALVYVSGWDAGRRQLQFEFASVSNGTGPQHSDVYSVASPRQYTATLAADLRVVSGGQICPPAGSVCSIDQLIAAAEHGFFAEVAIDPTPALHSILERDNLSQYAPSQPTPSPTGSGATPGPSAQPTA